MAANDTDIKLIAQLREEVQNLKKENQRLKDQFIISEQEEDHIAIALLKRLQEKKTEKKALAAQLEQEEEFLTNTLQKLQQVNTEKVELENQLEQEEEFLTNKLLKKLAEVQEENEALKSKIEMYEENHESMRTELRDYRDRVKKNEAEYNNYKKQNTRLKQQIERLKTDNFVLNQRINSGQELFNEMKREKCLLEADMERQSERVFFSQNRASEKRRGRSISHNPSHMMSPGFGQGPNVIASSPPDFEMDEDFESPRGPSTRSVGIPIINVGNQNLDTTNAGTSVPRVSCSPAVTSSSYVDSFLQSIQPNQRITQRSCVKRGWVKKYFNGIWIPSMFVVYDNGEFMFCDNESGVTVSVNLDTVVAVNDISKTVSKTGFTFPSFTFEVKTNDNSYAFNCDNATDHYEWIDLLRELAPMA